MIHYIFGSKSSRDYDILVLVDQIPNIAESKKLCESYDKYFQYHYPDKPVNVNLGVLNKDHLSAVYKGTVDEVNNSIVCTYNAHKQLYTLDLKLLPRDVDLKVVRAIRIILGFLSRTQYRKEIKDALYSNDIDFRLKTLESIDLTTIEEFNKNESTTDIFKTIAFQIGQTWCLMEGLEVYTKESIEEKFSVLGPFLRRESEDRATLNIWKNYFVLRCKEFRPSMKTIIEEFRK